MTSEMVTQPRQVAHKYVSTACTHDLHDTCRRQCKFCDARCLCWCHEHPRQAPPTEGQQTLLENLMGDPPS